MESRVDDTNPQHGTGRTLGSGQPITVPGRVVRNRQGPFPVTSQVLRGTQDEPRLASLTGTQEGLQFLLSPASEQGLAREAMAPINKTAHASALEEQAASPPGTVPPGPAPGACNEPGPIARAMVVRPGHVLVLPGQNSLTTTEQSNGTGRLAFPTSTAQLPETPTLTRHPPNPVAQPGSSKRPAESSTPLEQSILIQPALHLHGPPTAWTIPPHPALAAGLYVSQDAHGSWQGQGQLSYDPGMLSNNGDMTEAWQQHTLQAPPLTTVLLPHAAASVFARDSPQDVTIRDEIGAASALEDTHTVQQQPLVVHADVAAQPGAVPQTSTQHLRGRSTAGHSRHLRALGELRKLLTLALPCVVITGSPQVVVVVSQIVTGQRLGRAPLAAAAVGNMLWLLSYYAIIGTCTALETLGAQAVGAEDYGRLVVWDLAAACTTTLLALPFAGILWNAGSLGASLLGQDPAFTELLVKYCRGLVPGLLPAVWSIVLSKHLQAQTQVLLPAAVVGSAAAVYGLVVHPLATSYGLPGVSVGASIARAYQLFAMLLAVLAYESYKGAQWCSGRLWMQGLARWQAARRGHTLSKFLSLGAPGCLGAVMECAGWEVTTAMAAYLGTLQVAVHASVLSIATLVIMAVPLAVAIAANLRVAKLLGRGSSERARMCAWVAVVVGALTTSSLGVLLVRFRQQLGWAFTADDQAVVQLVADIAPLVAVYQGIAGVLGSTQGALRGVGRQGTLVVNVSLGLGVGTLLGAWMTWGPWDLGLAGLWRGSIVGTAVTALLNLVILVMVDWPLEVRQARNIQTMQLGVRARQQMIYRALRADASPDEGLVEALLAEAQQDPRPLHIIYQEYAGCAAMGSTSAPGRARSGLNTWQSAGYPPAGGGGRSEDVSAGLQGPATHRGWVHNAPSSKRLLPQRS